MNLKAKKYVESHKKAAQEKLAARRAVLKEKGLDDTAVLRDAMFRKIKADIRKANARLTAIAAQEKLNADNAKAKAEKQAPPQVEREESKSPKKKAADSGAKKPKEAKAKTKSKKGSDES